MTDASYVTPPDVAGFETPQAPLRITVAPPKELSLPEGFKPVGVEPPQGFTPIAPPAPVNLSDPATKAIVDQSIPGRIMNAAVSGAQEGYGTSKFGLSDESVAALRSHGIFNPIDEAKPGTVGGTMRSFLEAVTLPAAEQLDMALHTPNSMYHAAADAAIEGGKILDEKLGTPNLGGLAKDVAALPEAFPFALPSTVETKITTGLPQARDLSIVGPEAVSLHEPGLTAEAAADAVKPIVAYHGSPYSFNAFNNSNIGSGEGAASYGHGLYFAEHSDVATSYAIRLGARANGKGYSYTDIGSKWVKGANGDRDLAAKKYLAHVEEHNKIQGPNDQISDKERDEIVAEIRQPVGNQYQVRIHANKDHFLDWDKTLEEQDPVVRQALKRLEAKGDDRFDHDPRLTGEDFYRSGPAKARASVLLHEAGIPGIKYLDQGSRPVIKPAMTIPPHIMEALRSVDYLGFDRAGQALAALRTDIRNGKDIRETWDLARPEDAEAVKTLEDYAQRPQRPMIEEPEQQTHNLVVFNDKDVEITHKNGQNIQPPPPPVAPPIPKQAPGTNPWRDRFNIFVGNLTTGKDVKQLIENAADENGEFQDGRRGDISLAHQGLLQDATGMSPEEMAGHVTGMGRLMKNDAQVRTAMQIMVQAGENARDAAMNLRAADTLGNRQAFTEALMRRDLAVEQIVGLRAEWGRTGNVFQEFQDQVKDAQGLGKWLKDRKNMSTDDLKDLANAISGTNSPASLSRLLQESRKPGFYEKFMYMWMNGLLSGPFTHAKYVLANTAFATYDAAIRTPIAGVIGKFYPENKVYIGEGPARMYGLITGLPDAMRASVQAMKNGMITPLPRQVTTGEAAKISLGEAKRNPFGQGVGAKVVGAPMERGISAIHTMFSFLGNRSEIEALAYRQAAKEGLHPFQQAFWERQSALAAYPTEAMMDAGVENGRRLTFTQELGPSGKAFSNFLNNTSVGKGVRLIVPFFRVPANILKTTVANTPLAFFNKEARENLMGKHGPEAQQLAMAGVVAGGSLGAWTMTQVMGDRITGSGPSDPTERSGWLLSHQPYSVRIGNRWVSNERFGVLGSIMSTSADLAAVADKISEGEYAEATGRIVAAAHNLLQELPGMQGASDLMEMMRDPDHKGKRYAINLASTAIPYSSLLGQTASVMDPNLRETNTFLDGLKYKIPGERQTLYPVRDWTGQPMANTREGLGAVLKNKAVNTDPVDLEVERLGVHVAPPEKYLGPKDGRVQLTTEQYDKYQTLAGPLTREALKSLVEAPSWNGLNDYVKKELIEKTIEMSRRQAGVAMQLDNSGEIMNQGVLLKSSKFMGIKPPVDAHLPAASMGIRG